MPISAPDPQTDLATGHASLSIAVQRPADEERREDNTLARLVFGGTQRNAVTDGIAHPGLMTADGAPLAEIWRSPNVHTEGSHRGLNWRASDDFLFGWVSTKVTDDCFAPTRLLYEILFEALEKTSFPHLLRVWNFIPNINQGTGDDEQYKRFCLARAMALEEAKAGAADLPAATAVGAATERALVYFIAVTTPGRQLENVRQISAYHYPRQYGRRSPQFSRATLWQNAAEQFLFVSGTASIVGHESRHHGEMNQQLRESWRNLKQLCEDANCRRPLMLRAYVRLQRDLKPVQDFLRSQLPSGTPLICVQADICRAELLVEVEGIFAASTSHFHGRG